MSQNANQPTIIKVKISAAKRLIIAALKAKIVPILKGSPGCGKSQVIHQIAEEFNLCLIDYRLTQCDPTDLNGFPTTAGGRADYLPMKQFPLEGDELPLNPKTGKSYDGWLLFFDEATSAVPAIQAACYKITLDRMVGSRHLHKKCAIVLAGNLEDDGAIVHPMSTALQSRLQHIELVVDAQEWIKHAEAWGYNHKVTSYIKHKPQAIYTFAPDHSDCTYSCPRTLEFTSRILDVIEPDSPDLLPAMAGLLGEGVAQEMHTFFKIYDKLVTMAQIEANPEGLKVPEEPSYLYALTGQIAHNVGEHNITPVMKYIARMPAEFQMVCMRETVRRNKKLATHKAVVKWVAECGEALF